MTSWRGGVEPEQWPVKKLEPNCEITGQDLDKWY